MSSQPSSPLLPYPIHSHPHCRPRFFSLLPSITPPITFTLGFLTSLLLTLTLHRPPLATPSISNISTASSTSVPRLGPLNAFAPSTETIVFNGSLFKDDIYRGAAGKDVDIVWEDIGVNYLPALLTEEEGIAAGLGRRHARVSEKYGGGYIANVEGLHHLHCLDLLRQTLYFNYPHYKAQNQGAFENNDYVLRSHTNHCLNTLRQRLMCQPDLGFLGQIWWTSPPPALYSPRAFPDFNTEHRCQDFEAIRKWAEERQVPLDTPRDYLERPRREDVGFEIP